MSTAPVVSTYVNETPVFVNLRLTDINRVEILRGPQGTLYGSGSLGGSVRYIYNQPDFDDFNGEIRGGIGRSICRSSNRSGVWLSPAADSSCASSRRPVRAQPMT